MSKLSSFPVTNDLSYQKPELLKSYPDIDYEMIPIQDTNNYLAGQSKPFHINQLSFASLKNILKTAKNFELASKPLAKISSNLTLNISLKKEIVCIVISDHSDLTLLLPLEQVSSCRKTKKFTKIFLHNGQQLKTAISFKKLRKCLLKNGFTKTRKSHLEASKNKFSFLDFKIPLT